MRDDGCSNELMALGLNGMSLVNGESGRVAIPVPFQTGRVIPLVFGVGQGLSFRRRQCCVVTSVLPVPASREVALVL